MTCCHQLVLCRKARPNGGVHACNECMYSSLLRARSCLHAPGAAALQKKKHQIHHVVYVHKLPNRLISRRVDGPLQNIYAQRTTQTLKYQLKLFHTRLHLYIVVPLIPAPVLLLTDLSFL